MGKYIVTAGQNLFDVALHIYGSIEGITDLMMSNPELSMEDRLKTGDALIFTDDYIINAGVVVYNKTHSIVPANGERNVYPKSASLPRLAEVHLKNTQTSSGFKLSGSGKLEIDWGDNSPLQHIEINTEIQYIQHSFDDQISSKRKIRIYGDVLIQVLDFSSLNAQAVYLFEPLVVESFLLQNAKLNIDFLALLAGTYVMHLTELSTDSLLPLLENKKLMILDLSGGNTSQKVVDDYLIALVQQNYGRRDCSITFSIAPSGEYKEPLRDENQNYMLSSGMEAIWVLTHEPAWNESGYWRFIINGTLYTTQI